MDLTKEAIEKIVNLGKAENKVICEDGYTFVVDEAGHAYQITPKLVKAAKPLYFSTLNSLVQYIKSNFDSFPPLAINVVSHNEIKLFGQLLEDGERELFAVVKAETPNIHFDFFFDLEKFNIMLQSQFSDGYGDENDKSLVLKVVGNVVSENVATTGDDGVSQAITIKQGVNSQGVKVPNPVNLAPYRTFVEIDQPLSPFILRMKDGPQAALFEADGGMWKIQAMQSIEAYFKEHLSDLIKNDKLIILS